MFPFIIDKKLQLKIYYFYIMADGKCTKDEQERFSSICKSMDVVNEDIEEVINFCEGTIRSAENDNLTNVIEEITKLLANENTFFSLASINRDKKTQAKVIWTLINLGYADTEYSEPEQRVVLFLADYWKMDSAVLSDLTDTAETILALTKQKKWIKTTNKPYDMINQSIGEIDKSISQMFANVEILISEAEMA